MRTTTLFTIFISIGVVCAGALFPNEAVAGSKCKGRCSQCNDHECKNSNDVCFVKYSIEGQFCYGAGNPDRSYIQCHNKSGECVYDEKLGCGVCKDVDCSDAGSSSFCTAKKNLYGQWEKRCYTLDFEHGMQGLDSRTHVCDPLGICVMCKKKSCSSGQTCYVDQMTYKPQCLSSPPKDTSWRFLKCSKSTMRKALKKDKSIASKEKSAAWSNYKSAKKDAKAKYEDMRGLAWSTYKSIKSTAYQKYKQTKSDEENKYLGTKKNAQGKYLGIKNPAKEKYEDAKKNYEKSKAAYKKCSDDGGSSSKCKDLKSKYKTDQKTRNDALENYKEKRSAAKSEYESTRDKAKEDYEKASAAAKKIYNDTKKDKKKDYDKYKAEAKKQYIAAIKEPKEEYNKKKKTYESIKKAYDKMK